MLLNTSGNLNPKHCNEDHRPALKNPAVAHCQKTWEEVYRSVLKYRKSKTVALFDAGIAFRESLPLLVGRENISDLHRAPASPTACPKNLVLMEDTGTKLLYAAQVALAANPQSKKPQKAPKSSPISNTFSLLAMNSDTLPPRQKQRA